MGFFFCISFIIPSATWNIMYDLGPGFSIDNANRCLLVLQLKLGCYLRIVFPLSYISYLLKTLMEDH